jgi:hypothetical protein
MSDLGTQRHRERPFIPRPAVPARYLTVKQLNSVSFEW